MTSKRILLICGTRPEIIKMAPVWKAIAATPGLEPLLLHTGQHTDLAMPLYALFGMLPTVTLDLTRTDSTLAHLNALLLEKIGSAVRELAPDVVLVHGDTASACMGALAAFYEKIPVGHVEAGLRTGEKYSPFPEEMNRCIIGRVATWHYAPTALSRAALLAENIAARDICMTGNTVIDAARLTAKLVDSEATVPFWAENKLSARVAGHKLILVTAHRRENWGVGLQNIANATCDILDKLADVLVVWPLHANPAVADVVRDVFNTRGVDTSRVILCSALDYTALIKVLVNSWLVLTDSGGIQEEAAAFGIPVVVLRDSTERPELIDAGGGVLVGSDRRAIRDIAENLHKNPTAYQAMKDINNPFGDGTAALRIATHLQATLSVVKTGQKAA